MPQMSPIWWSTLFMVFIMSYMIMIMMMYFFNIYSMNSQMTTSKPKTNLTWKW